MRQISNRTELDSNSCIEDKDRDAEELTGWEIEDFVGTRKKQSKINQQIINYVNKKITLHSLFEKFHINFIEKYSPSGWTHYRTCPFPDHNDDTPSFGYNPEENRFFCFGCKRGGKAVHFMSAYQRLSLIKAADVLISSIGSIDDIHFELQNESQDKIDEALLDFSNTIRNFIQTNKSYSAIAFAERLTWVLDLYLTKHVSRSTIDNDNLLVRIELLKSKIESFKN